MNNSRGFALLAALWLLVALSTASLALALSARARRLGAANYAEGVRARAAAQAGIEQLRARLVERVSVDDRPDPWAGMDSVVDTLMLSDVRVTASVRDLGTMLNLNRANEDELRRLLVALRVDAGEADRLAQAIADWRDGDDLHRMRGAERADYLTAGAPVLPRNGPFQRLDELLDVRGMTPRLFDGIRPYLTLRGAGQVNVNLASRPVLLTIPGLGEEAVAALMRLRRERRILANIVDLERELSPSAREAFSAQLPLVMARATTESREVEVISESELTGSPVRGHVVGVFVRARGSVFYVWSSVE